MTNGEKLKEIFPNLEISPDPYSPSVDICVGGIMMMRVDRNWWNAEYKEPTTKNDLGVDSTTNTISFKEMIDNLKITAEDIENAEDLEYSIEPLIHSKNDLGVDCISRAKAQTEIEMNASRYTIAKERGGMGQVEWSDQLIKVSDAVDIIRDLPSVTPQEPRKGHWIPLGYEDEWCDEVCTCSECGSSMFRNNYCPNCGAEMESEVENGGM